MLQDDQFYMMSDCYLGLTDLDADKPILSSFGLEPKMETRNPSEPTGKVSCHVNGWGLTYIVRQHTPQDS